MKSTRDCVRVDQRRVVSASHSTSSHGKRIAPPSLLMNPSAKHPPLPIPLTNQYRKPSSRIRHAQRRRRRREQESHNLQHPQKLIP
jgi:hypothetical protein